MGFITLGVYAWNEQALQGAVMTMLAHGLSAAAVYASRRLTASYSYSEYGGYVSGLWTQVPRMAVVLYSSR